MRHLMKFLRNSPSDLKSNQETIWLVKLIVLIQKL